MVALELTASEILAKKDPEQIFTVPDKDRVHTEHLKLTHKWHPDVCRAPEADAVLCHLNILRDRAMEHIDRGVWDTPGLLTLKIANWGANTNPHKTYLKVNYHKRHSFELGDFYIGANCVVYLLKSGSEDLITNYIRSMGSFTYASDRMKEEMIKYLPQPSDVHHGATFIEISDGRKVLIIKTNPDQILLRDVVNYGKLDPKHTAWIISRLLNIACYLEYNKQTLNDISLDTVYISPAFHSVALLGGWWYSVPRDGRMTAIPRRTLNMLSPQVLATKKASLRTDLELIRKLARELLGDTTGSGPVASIPDALLQWARYPSSGSSKEDYAYWQDVVLPKAFGKRSFTPLNVTVEQIYRES